MEHSMVCISIPHLSSRWNWKKTVTRTLDCPTINVNPRQSAPYDHNARSSQTDRRTNIKAIARRFVLTNAWRAQMQYGFVVTIATSMRHRNIPMLYMC